MFRCWLLEKANGVWWQSAHPGKRDHAPQRPAHCNRCRHSRRLCFSPWLRVLDLFSSISLLCVLKRLHTRAWLKAPSITDTSLLLCSRFCWSIPEQDSPDRQCPAGGGDLDAGSAKAASKTRPRTEQKSGPHCGSTNSWWNHNVPHFVVSFNGPFFALTTPRAIALARPSMPSGLVRLERDGDVNSTLDAMAPHCFPQVLRKSRGTVLVIMAA